MGDYVKFAVDIFSFDAAKLLTAAVVSGSGTPDGWDFKDTNFGACQFLRMARPEVQTPPVPLGNIMDCIAANGYPLPLKKSDGSDILADLYLLQDLSASYQDDVATLKALIPELYSALSRMFNGFGVGTPAAPVSLLKPSMHAPWSYH